MQSRDNFDCLFFVVSFYPFFFVWGKRFDGVFISWDKKNNRPKSGGFREKKKKLDSFFVRFIKPLPPVVLFKKDDDFDDDDNALSV